MCRGFVAPKKVKALEVLSEELKLKIDDSIKTLRTKTSSISSSSSDQAPVKSCLKVKTQAESLKKKVSLSSEDDKSVYFSTLEVKVFSRRLGDNPCVSSGPPLTIAWDAEDTTSFEIKDYEETRLPRRYRESLLVSKLVRTEWLREEGYSRVELVQAQAKAHHIQRGRMDSAKESLGMVESKELVVRKLKKWVLHTPSDKELYVKWKQKQFLEESRPASNQVIACPT